MRKLKGLLKTQDSARPNSEVSELAQEDMFIRVGGGYMKLDQFIADKAMIAEQSAKKVE